MDYEEVLEKSKKDRLLAGHPIYVDHIAIYSPLLNDISLISENLYKIYIAVIIYEGLDLDTHFNTIYDNIINYSGEYLQLFYNALEFFTGQIFEKTLYDNDVFFVAQNSVLHRNNYNEFIESIKLVNGVEIKKTKKRMSDFEKKIEEAKKRLQKRLADKGIKMKNEQDNQLSYFDLISVLASNHKNLNLLNIWDLTFYQFEDQFQRTQTIENYHIGIQYLVGGADPKKINIKHYLQK